MASSASVSSGKVWFKPRESLGREEVFLLP
jgi:hypothetical protein